jgi:transcriptional regulator with XRE-family HTH domain
MERTTRRTGLLASNKEHWNARYPRAIDLGKRIGALRRSRRLTLQMVGHRCGLSVSTISKIERNQLSPTYENIIKLSHGLGVDIATLFSDQPEESPKGRRSITRCGQGKTIVTSTYDYEMLCTDLVGKKIIPLRTRIKAHQRSDFSQLIAHEGEEVIYVLSGRVELITEYYEPTVLEPGDCVYFDSTMGHVCIAQGLEDAEVFWVCSAEGVVDELNRDDAN